MPSSLIQFIILVVLFATNQLIIISRGPSNGWNDQYLDNLLCIPIILFMWRTELNWFLRKPLRTPLPAINIWIATVIIAVIAELVFPRLSYRFTADIVDCGYYAIGAVYFSLFMNKYH